MSTVEHTGIIGQVRKGMEVHTADGHKLGKVADVYYGTDPTASSPRCDEDICSRIEVHHGFLGRNVLYIPYNAIASVSAQAVMLNVDEASVSEHGWNGKPHWLE